MTSGIQPADLGFFSTLASAGSLSSAARELGVTTPAVSRHLALMEQRVGLALVNRTTRRMSLTPEGELYLEHARRILGEIDDMGQLLGVSKA
ncbi:MAG: LysR family transcriptional regulator, partial [Caldimonas sp.]